MSQSSDFDLSVIVPTYNSIAKMEETISSLTELTEKGNVEVIFVDDHSHDSTFADLIELAHGRESWQVHQLQSNSGSAAKPRNLGIGIASGSYIYFLDSDDVIDPSNLLEALETAKKYGYDVVRSSLKVRMGNGQVRLADNIPGWDKLGDVTERKRRIVRQQSLTCSFLIRRSLVIENDIRFDEQRRIGEDIKFTAEVLTATDRIGFRSKPTRTYVRNAMGEESVTQRISSEQFRDFVLSWTDVEDCFANEGISFVEEHGSAAIQYALRQFIWFKSEPLSREVFDEFSRFCVQHKARIRRMRIKDRYQGIIEALLDGDYASFTEATQLRVVVAGHDLKFMTDMIPFFESRYQVKVDKWDGHRIHDVRSSEALTSWGDLFWVEWLLGAAAWYSKKITNDQRLIVRAHRSEVTVDYGLEVDYNKVSAVITIAPHMALDFADRFDIDHNKIWVVPNVLAVDEYSKGEYNSERRKRIAMVGILPKLKGFARGIEILARLREEIPDAELWVFGKTPEDLDWLMKKEDERAYYEKCDLLIREYGLEGAVQYKGWVDTKQALSDVACVVSFSELEGMQVSVAEGFLSGGLGLTMNWRGAQEGYPREFVYDSTDDMLETLKAVMLGEMDLKKASDQGCTIIRNLYSPSSVYPKIDRVIQSVRA